MAVIIVPAEPSIKVAELKDLPQEMIDDLSVSPELFSLVAEDMYIFGDIEGSPETRVVIDDPFGFLPLETRLVASKQMANGLKVIFRKYFGGDQSVRIVDPAVCSLTGC